MGRRKKNDGTILGIIILIAVVVWILQNILWIGGFGAAIYGAYLWYQNKQKGIESRAPVRLIVWGLLLAASWFIFKNFWLALFSFTLLLLLWSVLMMLFHMFKKNPVWKMWSVSTVSALAMLVLSLYMFEPNTTEQMEQPVQQEVHTDKEVAPVVAKVEEPKPEPVPNPAPTPTPEKQPENNPPEKSEPLIIDPPKNQKDDGFNYIEERKKFIDEPPASEQKQDVYFSSCKEAKAAGVAPLYEGEPGYRPGLDRDKDGVACE